MNRKVMSALLLSAAMFGPAYAADLGGDCCADLEERVAELEATTARKGNRKVSLEIYGQVTTALLAFDNGDRSDAFVVDNSNSPTRFGFRGTAKINPTLTAGFNIEVAAVSASSGNVTEVADDPSDAADGTLAVRFANWYLSHSTLGKVSVGRISAATDGIIETDLVGTTLVSLPGFKTNISIGGKDPKVVNWGGGATGVMRDFDGDRVNGIRYDTPTFGGFFVSTSFSENTRYDVTLRYAGEFSGFRVAAGIGYEVGDDNTDWGLVPTGLAGNTLDNVAHTGGSASVLHVASGLFVTGHYGKRDYSFEGGKADYDETNWGLRAGIAKNWFGIGNTVIWGEYNNFDNVNNLGSEAEIWGIGLIQNIDAAALELFIAYKNHSVSGGAAAGGDDMDMIFSGARIKF